MEYEYSAHLQDFCLAEQLGLLSETATVVGDNVRLQGGTKDFKYLMLAHPSYETRVHDSSDVFSASFKYKKASANDYHDDFDEDEDELITAEKDEFTISVRKSHDWGPYREEGNKDFSPGYPKDLVRGHYYFRPASATFINELGRTPSDQILIDRIMNR